MTRILDSDLRLRKLCLIKKRKRRIQEAFWAVQRKGWRWQTNQNNRGEGYQALKQKDAKEVDAVFDASSSRLGALGPNKQSTGYSDKQARSEELAEAMHRLQAHLSIDSKTMLPLSSLLLQPIRREEAFLTLLEKATGSEILGLNWEAHCRQSV